MLLIVLTPGYAPSQARTDPHDRPASRAATGNVPYFQSQMLPQLM
jgi:hypothetical protein